MRLEELIFPIITLGVCAAVIYFSNGDDTLDLNEIDHNEAQTAHNIGWAVDLGNLPINQGREVLAEVNNSLDFYMLEIFGNFYFFVNCHQWINVSFWIISIFTPMFFYKTVILETLPPYYRLNNFC
jgi:hypothetical protein